MHLDMGPHTIGARFASDMSACRLYFVDATKTVRDVCLDRLNALGAAEKQEVLEMVHSSTSGIIRKVLDKTERGGGWMANFIDMWVKAS